MFQMENKPLCSSLLLSICFSRCLSLAYCFGWCNFTTSRTKTLMHLSVCNVRCLFALVWCKQHIVKAQKCMRKVLSILNVLTAFLSVSQAHMYKYRHSSPDPPLTHLRQQVLGALENIISAKQTATNSSASSHDLCPFTSFWSTTNLNRSTLDTTYVMSK